MGSECQEGEGGCGGEYGCGDGDGGGVCGWEEDSIEAELEVFESWDGIGVGEWGVAGFVEMESWCAALVRAKFTGEEEKDAGTKSIEGTIRKIGNYNWEKFFAKWDTRT